MEPPTLARLDGTGRQVLALRSYLRSASHLTERWSWTQEQIDAFDGSPEQRDLQQEIDRVRTAFVAANPGFELYVNSQVRSLDVQVAHWNSNESVNSAGDEILVAARARTDSPDSSTDRPERTREAFKAFLSGYRPVPAPTIAAPGLSLHGVQGIRGTTRRRFRARPDAVATHHLRIVEESALARKGDGKALVVHVLPAVDRQSNRPARPSLSRTGLRAGTRMRYDGCAGPSYDIHEQEPRRSGVLCRLSTLLALCVVS